MERADTRANAATILVVEDSATQRMGLRGALEEAGFTVVTAVNGREGLAAATAQAIDLVVTDVVMPEMDGFALCSALRAEPTLQHLPVILLTSLTDPREVIRALEAGADSFVRKPCEDKDLVSRVRHLLEGTAHHTAAVAPGIEVGFAGKRYTVRANRRQMLDMLLSSYTSAVQQNVALERIQSELQTVNKDLRTATEQLAASNRELDSFAHSVSHDLRAPLRAIDGFSRAFLEDHEGQIDEAGQEQLGRVRAAAQHMGQLIDELLQLSRLTRIETRLVAVDLTAMAHAIMEDLRTEDPQRAIDVHISPDVQVTGDPTLLDVALRNLLSNAWKFTSQRERGRIEVGVSEVDGQRTFFVRDNGAGFDMAYADKLFGTFQRLHNAAEFPGTGVGLAIVHRVIQRHGGRIWAEAVVGEGAAFFFTLPEPTAGTDM